MNLIITKELYKDTAPIDAMIASAKFVLKHQGGCYRCTTCFLYKRNMVGASTTETICTILGRNCSSNKEYNNAKMDAARQFLDIFDKPKVMHIDFMGE